MDILLALIFGAAYGGVLHFLMPGRTSRGAALAPMIGAVAAYQRAVAEGADQYVGGTVADKVLLLKIGRRGNEHSDLHDASDPLEVAVAGGAENADDIACAVTGGLAAGLGDRGREIEPALHGEGVDGRRVDGDGAPGIPAAISLTGTVRSAVLGPEGPSAGAATTGAAGAAGGVASGEMRTPSSTS